MPVSVCILSCIALPVRAMDAPTSPSRWGRFALEHRPVRLLCQACSGWPSFPFGCSWLCLPLCPPGTDTAARTSSPARPAEDCPLAQLSCFTAARSIRSGPPSAGWPGAFPSAACFVSASVRQDLRTWMPRLRQLGWAPSAHSFQLCPLLTAQVELGPDLGCALLSALLCRRSPGYGDSAVASV